jgi:Arc/MetJ family transcription regulator
MMLKLMIKRIAEMRTTMNLDDELVARAQELTGIKERNTLVRMGLEALVQREAGRRLARLGGTDPEIEDVPRRRESAA